MASAANTDIIVDHHDNEFNQRVGAINQGKTLETSTTAGPRSQPKKIKSIRHITKRHAKSSSRSRPKCTTSKDLLQKQRARPLNASSHRAKVSEEQESLTCTNAIDEVLSESDDLLRCAYEAQALGRLNEAQSYLYLAHARLVGLGRFVEKGYVVEEKVKSCLSDTGHEDRNETISVNNRDVHLYNDQKPTLDATTSMLTPHVDPLSLMSKITPSPKSTSYLSTIEGRNNLSSYLAQSAQSLLYKQKGIGNKYAAKADQSNRRKSRAKSFDGAVKEDSNLQRENIEYSQGVDEGDKSDIDANLSACCLWSSSVMTANNAALDAKTLMKTRTAALC